jgi:yjeF C-terminal region, hydroxyethylthiazole kinase-related
MRDNGVPPFSAEDTAELFPPRPRDSHKGTWGYIALIGGSLRYSGAIRLANLAACAMRAGAGVTRLCVPGSLCGAMVPHILESTLFPLSDREGAFLFREEEFREALNNTAAAAFGMGIGHTPETEKAVAFLIRSYPGTLILDADGLNALAALGAELLRERTGKTLLTPHLGEFSRLTGKSVPEIRKAPAETAAAFAAENRVTVLLKGPDTWVTDGDGILLVNRGCPGMGTAGSGDVLSGILAAVCGANPGARLIRAAAAGAWINGRAGEIAQARHGAVSMIASDTAAAVEQAIREVAKE